MKSNENALKNFESHSIKMHCVQDLINDYAKYYSV